MLVGRGADVWKVAVDKTMYERVVLDSMQRSVDDREVHE